VYRIYNDTFTFRVSSEIKKPVLTAHTSPGCSSEWTNGTLLDFLERHKFGSRHEYDRDEYKALVKSSRSALVVVEEALLGGQRYALERLPAQFCGQIVFGWIRLQSAKLVAKELKHNASDLPMIVVDDRGRCRAFHRGRVAEAGRSAVLQRAVAGELCIQGGRVTATPFAQAPAPAQAADGTRFSMCFTVAILAVIALIRTLTPDGDAKQE
jgi:hypothetical protein